MVNEQSSKIFCMSVLRTPMTILFVIAQYIVQRIHPYIIAV